MKSSFLKISLIYLAVYISILVMPGVVVYPIDWVAELITGIHYVDGWTHGLMVYTALVFLMPVIYIIVLVTYWIKKSKQSKENDDQKVDSNC